MSDDLATIVDALDIGVISPRKVEGCKCVVVCNRRRNDTEQRQRRHDSKNFPATATTATLSFAFHDCSPYLRMPQPQQRASATGYPMSTIARNSIFGQPM